MTVALYVEGGGRKVLSRECRRGLGEFIERAGLGGRVHIVACGRREDAYQRFRNHDKDGTAMLLVDAEGPVTAQNPWAHLLASDGWARPSSTTDDQCHLMVQIMESWFLADASALESFYGRGFQRQALPANPDIEQVPKQDVLNGLAHATRNASKGRYGKGGAELRDTGGTGSRESQECVAPCGPIPRGALEDRVRTSPRFLDPTAPRSRGPRRPRSFAASPGSYPATMTLRSGRRAGGRARCPRR